MLLFYKRLELDCCKSSNYTFIHFYSNNQLDKCLTITKYKSFCHTVIHHYSNSLFSNTFSHLAGALHSPKGNVLSDAVAGGEGPARGRRTSEGKSAKTWQNNVCVCRLDYLHSYPTFLLLSPLLPPPFLSPFRIITRQIAGVNVTGRTDGES